jgi:hypothetical protein
MRATTKTLSTLLALLFLISLWTYQLPNSALRRSLLTVTQPVARIIYTNRRYRMYAPDPRAHKNVPFLVITDIHQHSEHYNFDDPTALMPSLSPWGREKWSAFIYHIVKSLLGEWPIYPPPAGRAHFERLAARLCQRESVPPRASIQLATRPVSLGAFQEAPQWGPIQILARYDCSSTVMRMSWR